MNSIYSLLSIGMSTAAEEAALVSMALQVWAEQEELAVRVILGMALLPIVLFDDLPLTNQV